MYTEADCFRKQQCSWDGIQKNAKSQNNKTFTKREGNIDSQLIIQPGLSLYCNSIQLVGLCQKTYPCAWIEQKCSHFTSCSAFILSSVIECQTISNRCISNGNECIEKNICQSYTTQLSCSINKQEKFCFWNNTDSINPKCEDVKDCSQLPISLTTDSQCRFQLPQCTTKIDGGCIESGESCLDQIAEISCVTNRSGDQQCFWMDNQCLDKICENAPLQYILDQECKDFLTICTTKQDGGCTQRYRCSDAFVETACITDIYNNYCHWDGTSCNNRKCYNAPQSYQTNEECNEFLQDCITTGNGCIENSGCEAALVKQACDQTLTGILCHWDGSQCKVKKCENAGPQYIGHKACNDFMPNCTARVNESSGCMKISCLSAPIIYNTNDLCNEYLPNHNCITKNGGGCKVNTTCENIDIEIACIKDVNNKDCYWYDGCKLKTCANAPILYNTHQLCQQYSKKCSVGTNQRCIDLICENIIEKEDCIEDFNTSPCYYIYTCQDKSCSLASKSIQQNEDCINYLSTCILDNSGFGCMDIPDECSSITNIKSCKLNKQGEKCGWNGNNCNNYNCYTASIDMNSTEKCKQYKLECVVNNELTGCMDLPNNCQDRKQMGNCEIEVQPKQKCQWDSINTQCIDIKCENAHLVTLLNNVTQDGCWNFYQQNCIINKTSDKCIDRPISCDNMNEFACKQDKVLTTKENCYWDPNQSICKPYQCSSISFAVDQTIDHFSCYNIMNKCTLNTLTWTDCADLTSCDMYDMFSCYMDNNQNPCQWDDFSYSCLGSTQTPKTCENIENTSIITHSDCQKISTNCTVNQYKCTLKKYDCFDYTNSISCLQDNLDKRQNCKWDVNLGCMTDNFSCTGITGTGLTAGYCNMLDSTCSVNSAKTQCIVGQDYCGSYSKTNCLWALYDGYCTYVGSKCVVDCSRLPGPDFDILYCQWANALCTVKYDGSGCVNAASTCASNLLANCTADKLNNYCYPKKGTSSTTCVSATTYPLADCTTLSSPKLSYSYCSFVSPDCSINASQTQCIPILFSCSEYQPQDCYLAQMGYCTLVDGACTDLINDEFICQNIKIYGVTLYTNYLCQQISYSCIASEDKSGCIAGDLPQNQAQICSSYTGTNLTYYYCVDKLIDCSVNAARTACVNSQTLCEYYSIEDCYYATSEGECIIENEICVQKKCENAPLTATTNAACLSYSTNCILRQGGCQTKSTCDSYFLQSACVQSLDGQDCLWNLETKNCVIKSCLNAESSTYFDTDAECAALGDCTVKANADKTIGLGCMPLAGCDTYVIQEQCKINDKREQCLWITNNPDNPFCSEKSCSTADLSINTHENCMEYFPNCTVNIVNSLPQGCTTLKPCDQYIADSQCKISSFKDENNQNIECGWNGQVCANKSCLTADQSFNDPTKCANYQLNCTINSTNNGCTQIPNICEGMTKEQCYEGSMDFSKRNCMWQENQCVTKKCQNLTTTQNCEAYLQSCTIATQKCITGKPKVCSDFSYTTDSECSSVIQNANCTTNGLNCIQRGLCQDAKHKAGCTKDINGTICEWVIGDDQSQICVYKSCFTASKTLKTEQECSEYFPISGGAICTTKKNGGCLIKGNCETLTIEEICKTDKNGQKCVWDKDLFQCRYPNDINDSNDPNVPTCIDYLGLSHEECQSQNNNCTLGLNGKCTFMTSCESIKIKELCYIGNNGPCIWIYSQPSQNYIFSGCFKYNQCESLKWKTDSQCKLISPFCTTNGIECVGIRKCSETNTNGGCAVGIDGLCVQTPTKLGDANLICKKFTTCNEVYYLTHNECQKANSNCTSDSVNGCIPLAECKNYLQQGSCNINKLGMGKDQDNLIITTGNCIWDKDLNYCRDEQCSDIQLSTEFECSSKLSNCTSDGNMCLIKGECTTYQTENACNNAGGTDGPCIWISANETNPGLCRIKVCAEIQNGSTQEICSTLKNCVTDGQNCISIGECSSYITQISCQQKGLDDGCLWVQSTPESQGNCQKMTACRDAKDQFKCDQVKERCYWQVKDNSCVDHSCETFQIQEGKCLIFSLGINKKCISSEVQSLTEDNCYNLSGKLYSWNPYFLNCLRCEKVFHNQEYQDEQVNNNTLNEVSLREMFLLLMIVAFQ